MPRLLTERTFFRYLKCPNWVWFDAHGGTARAHEPLMEALQDEGLMEEKQRALMAAKRDVAEVRADDEEQAFAQTLAFMREGRQTIYRGVLIDGHWVGHPDLLEKVQGRSLLGDWYYVAADMKRGRAVRDEYKFQGCFYAELLQRLQGVRPYQGYVMTPDGKVLSYLIEKFEKDYALTLDGIERILAGVRPPHFLTSGCKQSPWFKECRSLSDTCEDISLLNRVWREEVARLSAAGIKTVAQLAKLSVRDLQHRIPLADPGRLELLRDQALALTEKRTIIRGRAVLPVSPVELFFDIESDPLRDIDYLFGVLVVEKGLRPDGTVGPAGKAAYHRFFAADSAQEETMWRAFLAFLEQYPEAPIYHYGAFEVEVTRRFEHRFGSTPVARTALARNMIDLLSKLRDTVLFPLSFYSLKDIATHLGFHWRAADASGANSVLWFEQWLRVKDEAYLEKIFAYNEDDVRATHLVQAWLKEHAV